MIRIAPRFAVTEPVIIEGLFGGEGDCDGCSLSIVAITDPTEMLAEHARIIVGAPPSSTLDVGQFACSADTAVALAEALLNAADAVGIGCPAHAPRAVEARRQLIERIELAKYGNGPQVCGWCVRAAGDTQEAADAATRLTLAEVREHTLTCEYNPTYAAFRVVREQLDAALGRAAIAEREVVRLERLRGEGVGP